jgi:hypothetical protein
MFPVGDNLDTCIGIPNLLDSDGSEQCVGTLLVKWLSTFNSRIYEG